MGTEQHGSRVTAAAERLRIDAATAEVIRAFETEGVEALLLKGPSIEQWLYVDGEPRGYSDCDILIRPDQLEPARRVLASLGFREDFEEDVMPTWWRKHANEWCRRDDGVIVDLHRQLQGVGADPEQAWRHLAADPERIDVGGHAIPVLDLTARALNVALHAAHHGSEWGGPIADLELALEKVDESTWQVVAALAERLRAVDAFSAGLRLTPKGRELAARLDLPAAQSVEAALRASTPPAVALGFDQLAQATSWSARAAIVWRKVFPPPEFIRRWAGASAETRLGLVRAYLWRPVWLLGKSPEGLRAWLRARRRVSGGTEGGGSD